MEELGKKKENNRLYFDNTSAINIVKNSTFHSKTKRMQLRYHFIQSILEGEHLKLEKINTSQNPANMLAKAVTREKLSSYSVLVGSSMKVKMINFPGPRVDHSPTGTKIVQLL
jgi:hypothetical protein